MRTARPPTDDVAWSPATFAYRTAFAQYTLSVERRAAQQRRARQDSSASSAVATRNPVPVSSTTQDIPLVALVHV